MSAAISGTGKLPIGQELLQGLAIDEFRDDERRKRVIPRVVEDLHDAVVFQLGHGPRLALQARARFSLGEQVRVQDLDRYLASQSLVLRTIDDGHAALADFFDDSISRWQGVGKKHSHHTTTRPVGLG